MPAKANIKTQAKAAKGVTSADESQKTGTDSLKKDQAKTAAPANNQESSDDEKTVVHVAPKKAAPANVKSNAKTATKKQESSEESTEESTEESESEEEAPKKKPAPPVKKPAPKAPPKKAKSLTESESESSESSESEEEAPKKKPAPKKKETSSEESSDSSESEEQNTKKPAAKPAQKGKAPKKEDLDDILGEFAADSEQKLSKAQLKRLKKKEEAAPVEAKKDTPKPEPEKKAETAKVEPEKKKETDKATEVTDQLAAMNISTPATTLAPAAEGEDEDLKDGDEKKLSKTQRERLRKKEKEAKAKEAPKVEQPQSQGAKKPSALAERIKREREELARLKQEEADRIAAEEAAEKARIEEEKRLEAEKERKKKEKADKRAADLKSGAILSSKDKKKAEANRQALEAMKAAGLVVGPAAEGEKKKRPVYGKKPKTKDDKPGAKQEDTAEQGSPHEPEQDAKRAELEAAEKRKQEEAAAAAEKQDEIDEKEPDWEAMMASSDPGEEAAVKESWDVDSEEEREKEAVRKAAHEKRKGERVQEVTRQRKAFEERRAARLARIEARNKEKEEKRAKEKEAKAKKGAAPAPEAAAATQEEDGKDKRKDFRSPICCILGHVDTGKTKLLDKIRHTNVQDMEAGGITQQIGATYFPTETIKMQTQELQEFYGKELDIKVPGLLVIDTPGHESFANLRSRGSGLCDIAILVVDIMAGLEKQTLESINLLKMRKTPFVVALNKCDRMFGWKAIPNCPFRKTLATQTVDAQQEFDRRMRQIMVLFSEQGLNTCVYWENKDFKRNISIIPTSAITGEGVPDLLTLLVQLCQKMMTERLMYIAELQCTVLEVKVVEGHGTTIDIILVNGVLHEGDTIVLCGMQGPIVTKIRALLTPPPMRELRVKADYTHLKTVKAAAGLKISAPNLEHAVPGSQLLVCGPRDNIDELKDAVMQDLQSILSRVDRSGIGVCVQASTLGSLEALLAFLKESKIPVSGIAIGPVHKKDVMRAGTMIERRREYAVILAFDVTVSAEAHQWATELGVRIFTADIIYHLFEMCTNYMAEVRSKSIDAAANIIVFPCILEIMKDCVFHNRDPLLLGVRVLEGIVKVGTPLCIPDKENLPIGRITSVQRNHQEVTDAKQGDEVCIKIEAGAGEQKTMFGRQFDYENHLVSRMTRASIEQLKVHFPEETNWVLVRKLKKMFEII